MEITNKQKYILNSFRENIHNSGNDPHDVVEAFTCEFSAYEIMHSDAF